SHRESTERFAFSKLPIRSHPVKLRCYTILNKALMGGQDAHPTRKFTLRFTGILPVLENDAAM
ncbi:MAG TPA: hypothetical protein VLA84_02935, partial [Microcoleus sp.]|nr:hypothetical protein [Microcoleus sp.]